MAELTIFVNTHHLVVKKVSARARPSVENFIRKNIQYGSARTRGGKYTKTALKVYAASTRDRTEYRVHINQLDLFLEHIDRDQLRGSLVEIIYNKAPPPVEVEFVLRPHWQDRPHQPPVIEYLVNPEPPRSKLVSLRPGKGKSYCSMKAMMKLAWRTLIIVKPKYIEKWVEDILRTYDINPDDIMVIRGGEQLQALIMMAKAGELKSKIIIISNKTLQLWISFYELHGRFSNEMGYDCYPDELCTILGVGIRLIDEVHEDYHLNFKIDLYTHVERSFSLSATLTSYDPFQEAMYAIAYPPAQRYEGPKFENYVISRAVFYRFARMEKVRYKDPATGNYSHHVLEKSVLRDEDMTANYLEMVESIFKEIYLKKCRPGKVNRCLIFASSIALCTVLTSYFQKKYPTIDSRRYCEEDPYANLMEAEIIVSTLFSAGTGVDIPDLIAVIMTTSILSKQGNIQGHGRLRELPDGHLPEFAYLVCTDISKHVEYHQRKSELLEKESAIFRTDTYHDRI